MVATKNEKNPCFKQDQSQSKPSFWCGYRTSLFVTGILAGKIPAMSAFAVFFKHGIISITAVGAQVHINKEFFLHSL